MGSVVVLLSGGIDSAVCLAMNRGNDRHALVIDYGQPHSIEIDHAELVAEAEGVKLDVLDLPVMPKTNDVVFACRNAAFACVGAAYASSVGADQVVLGSNQSDWERFPDCRPVFWNDMRKAFRNAEYPVSISTPLLRLSKAQVVNMARSLDVDLSLTWSCYASGPDPCGECLACETRKEAGA